MNISFRGADRSVTGSCHLLECGGRRVLIDCGLLQGGRDLDEESFDAAAVDFFLLTHAHLDHCGRLPLLVKRGFRGEVIATGATRVLVRVVLLDAANLQEEERRRRQRQARRRGQHRDAPPLYSLLDALDTLDRFGRVAGYDAPVELAPGLRASFRTHPRLCKHLGRHYREWTALPCAVLRRPGQCRAAACCRPGPASCRGIRRNGDDLR